MSTRFHALLQATTNMGMQESLSCGRERRRRQRGGGRFGAHHPNRVVAGREGFIRCFPLSAMALRLLFLVLLDFAVSDGVDILFNGFRSANLALDGTAEITPDGLLKLTNSTKLLEGHAFYPAPIRFKESPSGKAFSFSTTYAFGILSEYSQLSGNGIAFVISPSRNLTANTGSQYLGILSPQNNGNATNHLVAVELDTIYNPDLRDIDDNHVGIDVNNITSVISRTASYYDNGSGEFRNVTLIGGDPMQVWVDYDGEGMRLNVTLGLLGKARPSIPLLSANLNLTGIILEQMYVGFSSSTGSFLSSHFILGWSFKTDGVARALGRLPSLPRTLTTSRNWLALALGLSLGAVLLVLVLIAAGVFVMFRNIKFSELLEDWEVNYGPQRFTYRELYRATKGFKDKELLGVGGFGKVYRGILPESRIDVAVKKVSHESRQGMKEFVAEIVSIGKLRHRNLVQLLGYCRRKGELLLVYDYMPNGSLDKLLFDRARPGLPWSQRLHIIKGVASGLFYLHEEWEKVVVHRDVKASNVLLDSELNGRLGDFGLARLYDHGNDPRTTRLVGTMGYLAPELIRTGKATKLTDVFSFGALLLEVACGRRPIEHQAPVDEVVLLSWALKNWRRGKIQDCADPMLRGQYDPEEMDLMLKLGLLCSHPLPANRPTMRQVIQYLDGDIPLPELSAIYLDSNVVELLQTEVSNHYSMSSPNSSSFSNDSLLHGGR